MPIRSYRELIAWRKAMDLVNTVYAATRVWPSEELYSLTNQVRRAAVSVPSNIAEGQGRSSTKEFLKHVSIAYGSLMEVETQIIIAQEQGYCSAAQAEEILALAAEVGRVLNGLSNSLKRKLHPRRADHCPPTTDPRPLTPDH